ncbi:MAG: transposase [Planctomycetaceae bacterium]
MSKQQSKKVSEKGHRRGEDDQRSGRRRYTEEFKAEAVQMLLDGHAAASVCERLGLSGVNLLYFWKRKLLLKSGPAAESLEARVRQLEVELKRVERERDILTTGVAR